MRDKNKQVAKCTFCNIISSLSSSFSLQWFHKTNCYRGHNCNGNLKLFSWSKGATPDPQPTTGSLTASHFTTTSLQPREQRPTTLKSVFTQTSSTFTTHSSPSSGNIWQGTWSRCSHFPTSDLAPSCHKYEEKQAETESPELLPWKGRN